jgi:phosphoribosyl 1,2-cyclic phosphodiesterase
VDAGISCRETEIRMKRLGLDISKLKAIFISHEHKDHISGITVLSKKYKLPVYITEGTQKNGKVSLERKLVQRFSANEIIKVGGLTITGFQKNHDAEDPHSFVVSSGPIKIGVFTDIGIVCEKVMHHFKQCNAVFLEANYDEQMLQDGNYPYFLKQRITDGRGHLSNTQALELFQNHKPSYMSHLILSHLSKNNNSPELVRQLFSKYAAGTHVTIASRDRETEIFHINNTANSPHLGKKKMPAKQPQLSLF